MKRKTKVVIDTNVFINSWFSNKYFYCDAVIDLVKADKLQLLFSQEMIGELFYVVKNAALNLFDDRNDRLKCLYDLSDIFLDAFSVNTLGVKSPEINDEFDKMLLKTAIKGGADFIISEDYKSGIHEIRIEGLRIVSAEEFISVYERLLD